MPVPTGPSYSTPPLATTSQVSVARRPRTLVLCFDGTADQYDSSVTNVVKLYSLLRKDKVEDQLTYYQAGVGTYFEPGVVRPFFRWWATLLDEAIAWYLYEHVIDGYKFLMQNYNVGDKVCLFGFSRGAYIARALAGMLHKVGLLSKDNTEQISFAYRLFKSTSKSDEKLAPGFKETFCRPVPIEFLGVWDTVASVGIFTGKTLPFVDVNTTIGVFRQALSLDEHRTKFRPNLYHHDPTGKDKTSTDQQSTNGAKTASGPRADEIFRDTTDVKEVWFSGCHTDIGGGNALNNEHYVLANIPLRWMIEQIVCSNAPIHFNKDAFAQWYIPTTILKHDPAAPSQEGVAVVSTSEDDDEKDAVQKLTDELFKQPLWWILEVLPFSYTNQTTGKTTWWPNFGRGRQVPPDSLFHASVKLREKDAKLKYKPRARYEAGTIRYVDN